MEKSLKSILHQNAKLLRVCARSKRWWTTEVSEQRANYKAYRHKFQSQHINLEGLQLGRKIYYKTIRKAKRTCWVNFLQGPNKIPERQILEPNLNENSQKGKCSGREKKGKCCVALRLIKPLELSTTPAIEVFYQAEWMIIISVLIKMKMIDKVI